LAGFLRLGEMGVERMERLIRLTSSIVNGKWDQEKSPFYLEFYGETRPVVNSTFAEVLAAGPVGGGPDSGTPAAVSSEPVYEYWWTLGFHRGHHPTHPFLQGKKNPNVSGEEVERVLFDQPAAWVGLFFPTDVNWRVKEIAATLKFLTPINSEHHKWADVSEQIAKLSPLAADAGSLASLVPGGAGVSTVLNTVARLQVGSVPQTTVDWTVEQTAHPGPADSLLQGVEWLLPQDSFDILGGRVSGSVAVTFMEAMRTNGGGDDDDDDDDKAELDPGKLRARANVAIQSRELCRIPDPKSAGHEDGYLTLAVKPTRVPANAEPPAKN